MGGFFFLRLKKLSQSTAKHTTEMRASFDETRWIKTCRSSTKNRSKYRRQKIFFIRNNKRYLRVKSCQLLRIRYCWSNRSRRLQRQIGFTWGSMGSTLPRIHQWFVRNRKSLFLEKRHLISKAQFGFYEPLLSKWYRVHACVKKRYLNIKKESIEVAIFRKSFSARKITKSVLSMTQATIACLRNIGNSR